MYATTSPNAIELSPHAHEQSLLQSFMAIHEEDSIAGYSEICNGSLLKKDRYRKALRKKRVTRRVGVSPTTLVPKHNELPSLPFSSKRESSRECSSRKLQRRDSPINIPSEEQIQQGFRKDYILGETARSTAHMIVGKTSEDIESLKRHDFAFVKRSDGSFTYAILAYRSFEKVKGSTSKDSKEECLVFVISKSGATKSVRKKHWREFVRLVYTEEDHCKLASSVALCKEIMTPQVQVCQEIEKESEDIVPGMVLFVPTKELDDECSLISSVSDRAMMISRRRQHRYTCRA